MLTYYGNKTTKKSSPERIKLSPDLSAAAFLNKTTNILITWHRLRSLNTTGSGFISLPMAIEGLIHYFGCSEKTARRHILRSNDKVLKLIYNNRGSVIKIYGLFKVCEWLGINRITDSHWRVVSAQDYNSMSKARAQLYASIHKPKDIIGNPMSRETITERTRLHKVQQRRYEKQAHVKRAPNYAFYRDTDPLGKWGYKPVKQEIFTKSQGFRQIKKRLGNTYHSRQEPGSKGMLRKVNAELKRSYYPDEAPTLVKRFFASFRKLSKAIAKRCESQKEGYYLINSKYRTNGMKKRLEWCIYETI